MNPLPFDDGSNSCSCASSGGCDGGGGNGGADGGGGACVGGGYGPLPTPGPYSYYPMGSSKLGLLPCKAPAS